MHCLGAGVASGQHQLVATSTSPCASGIMICSNVNQGISSSCCASQSSFHPGSSPRESNVIQVARALGLLVCEGRLQGGSPRGYKEGVHCNPPLQPVPKDHNCEKGNNLCERYLVFVREITERISLTSLLCVEVLLCTDCPCGLIKAKSKHRISSSQAPACGPCTASPWSQQSSSSTEMLLEYWCIGVVPSNSTETMNALGLYQAVRSRLHFSQLAAWWSNSAGVKPNNVATRIVPYTEDHLHRFREQPNKHSFPLAGIGDGNSIKVTMWALPRMEEIPVMICPQHHSTLPIVPEVPATLNSTPSFTESPIVNAPNTTSPSEFPVYMINFRGGKSPPPEVQVVPTPNIMASPLIVDDGLISPCDQPGKHHCRCGEDEAELDDANTIRPQHHPAPLLVNRKSPLDLVNVAPASVGERKRRRSLPCRAEPLDGLEKSFRTQLQIESQRRKQAEQQTGAGEIQQQQPPQQQPPIIKSSEKRYKRSDSNVCVPVHQQPQPQQQTPDVLDWIARVPARVMGKDNCSLGLSQREFEEVLAVLRTRTPLRTTTNTMQQMPGRRKERTESSPAKLGHSEQLCNNTNKADVLLGAILRSSGSSTASTAESEASGSGATCSSSGAGLNKKLHRLRQLFKRDQELRVRRKIDFQEMVHHHGGHHRVVLDGSRSANRRSIAQHNLKPMIINNNNINIENNNNNNVTNNNHNKLVVEDSTKSREVAEVVGGEKAAVAPSDEEEDEDEDEEEEEEAEEECEKEGVPTAKDQQRFRKSLENAASMVFHSRTGLPLTSSPAPLRRGHCCFDFDDSLNSVSSKRSALFELNTPPSPGAVSLEEGDKETEYVCDNEVTGRRSTSRNRAQSHALLGNFEESALNGRLEPVSTVQGFTAEVGASGTFCPKHLKLPVTVFFYTLGDNDKVSSPYLAHINLGKKGYQVPRTGTVQVTLLNPLGTVVKMFVVLYDLSDMPARSHTFLRQRTLRDRALRYLIHLRFMSGKSGRIYLHTDIRMIICRKSDVDTASCFGTEPARELRSFVHGPTNPKFSPRC